MKAETLMAAIAEANRFIAIAAQVEFEMVTGTHDMAGEKWDSVREYTKESAACKRASMDLTRVLARLRNGD